MKIKLIIILMFCAITAITQNQTTHSVSNPNALPQRPGFDIKKLKVGGNFSLQFGTVTYIEMSPMVSYEVMKNTFLGLGGSYIYYADKRYNFSTSIYGGRVFGQYFFENLPIMLHAEYESLSLEYFGFNQRLWVDNVYVGGGYAEKVTENSYLIMYLLFNVTQNVNSLYGNPILRFAYIGGF